MGAELEVLKETRIVSFNEMKKGQIGIIINHNEYDKEIVIRLSGGIVASLTNGGTWTNTGNVFTLKVRLLEVGEKIVITEN